MIHVRQIKNDLFHFLSSSRNSSSSPPLDIINRTWTSFSTNLCQKTIILQLQLVSGKIKKKEKISFSFLSIFCSILGGWHAIGSTCWILFSVWINRSMPFSIIRFGAKNQFPPLTLPFFPLIGKVINRRKRFFFASLEEEKWERSVIEKKEEKKLFWTANRKGKTMIW